MKLYTKIRNFSLDHYWNIGFIEIKDDAPILVQEDKIHWLKHNFQSKGWFADPFILEYDNNNIFVLVEEFDYDTRIGYISKLVVNRSDYTLKDRITLLKLDSHLSFPNVIREKGHTYLYPENGAVNVLNLYELDNINNKLTFVKTLIHAPLSDASIYHDERGYFILATLQPDDNKDELVIYHSNTLLGEYSDFKHVKFPDNSARNAGAIYKIKDRVYKISQDCNGGYGMGLKLYEMKRDFSFHLTESFYLKKKPIDGLHTYNRYKDLAVVDFHAPRRPVLNNFWLKVSKIRESIKNYF